jgi:hypothetical protein
LLAIGCFYNFCDYHHSLQLKLSVGPFRHHWVQRTPAIAAKLTDHTQMDLFRITRSQSAAAALETTYSARQTFPGYARFDPKAD